MSKFVYKMNSVAKLLEQIASLKKKEERIEALKVNGHYALKMILKGMFDPSIKFLLPEGDPPFKPNQFDEPKALLNEVNRFYLFVEGGHKTLQQPRREKLFIDILEAVSADDAKLLLAMKDKKSPYKGITYDIVKEAFPELNLP
jgi:Family of unknown function (DUF6433)